MAIQDLLFIVRLMEIKAMPTKITLKLEFADLLKEIQRLEDEYDTYLRIAAEAWQKYADASWSKQPQEPCHVQGLKDCAIYHSEAANKVGEKWVQKLSVKSFMLERHKHLKQVSL